jgi:hypothetical protein
MNGEYEGNTSKLELQVELQMRHRSPAAGLQSNRIGDDTDDQATL